MPTLRSGTTSSQPVAANTPTSANASQRYHRRRTDDSTKARLTVLAGGAAPRPGSVGDVPRGALHWALPVQGGSRSVVGRVPVPRDGSGACCSRSWGSRRPVVWSKGSGSATRTPLTRKPDS